MRLAQEIGDESSENHWQQIYHIGKENFKKLWNGEYFSLWVDREERDECLMSGQLDPAWYCRMLGLPSYVEDEYTKKVLDMVWKYNYTKESGLINASYPEGKTPTLYTYDNVQVQSNWSGMEYIFASMFMEMGYFDKAVEIAGNVENRHRQAGRIFNHEECGNHYYRPMASWTLLLSLSGLRYEKNRKAVMLNPKQEELTVPWFTTQGYGMLEVKKDRIQLRCLEGSMDYKTICLWGERKAEQILVSGEAQEFEQNGLEIVMQTESVLNSGDELLIISSCPRFYDTIAILTRSHSFFQTEDSVEIGLTLKTCIGPDLGKRLI